MFLRARIVLPISKPPIEDGVVSIFANRVTAVGTWSDFAPFARAHQVLDLGDVIVLPGLINAHCHLDYTDVAGQIPPSRFFTDWIKTLLAFRAGWSYSEFAQSWLHGARMLLRSGSTTVADIEMVPDLFPHVPEATPLRVFSFLEMTGVRSQRPPREILQENLEIIERYENAKSGMGLSPHAPYSTSPELLQRTAHLSRKNGRLVAMHLSESEQEFEMFMTRRGALFDWLSTQRDMSDCGHGSPVRQVEHSGLLSPRFIAVHVNYLAPGDAELLGKNKCSVVHCPRSHAYFRHAPFPRAELAEAGVNLCLGTDSLASVSRVRTQPDLNLFTEMSLFAANHPDLLPATIVQMATVNGASALKKNGRLGELRENAMADLISLPFTGKISDAFAAVVHHTGPVRHCMIDGQWIDVSEHEPTIA